MARLDGEMSPKEAADALGCHKHTVYRWAVEALEGEPSRIPSFAVRRDFTGHVWLKRRLIERLAAEAG